MKLALVIIVATLLAACSTPVDTGKLAGSPQFSNSIHGVKF